MSVQTRKASEKYPGTEPLPGYHLIKLLGRGGFGEVWKCEAPGGLHKAVKFVAAGGEQFRQELAAFEQIRGIRHPYLLTLERVEQVDGELVTILELADCQLQDRFRECQGQDLAGIPRLELLGYLIEAAEALDMLSQRHGLQHLDVKPENIFLLSGHVKVGDYGLVRRRKPDRGTTEATHGFTPRYSAPEILEGRVDHRSDQYSLALVFAELLNGRFPYSGTTAQKLMIQHRSEAPNLTALAREDEPSVRRALSKEPSERFPSCVAFIQALSANPVVTEPTPSRTDWPPDDENASEFPASDFVPSRNSNCISTLCSIKPVVEIPVEPSAEARPVFDRPRRSAAKLVSQAEKTPIPQAVEPLPPVVTLDYLHGMPAHQVQPSSLKRSEYLKIVVQAAAGRSTPIFANDNFPEDALVCRFLSTLPAALVPLKVAVVAEAWGMSLNARNPMRLVLRAEVPEPKPTRVEPRGLPARSPVATEIVIYRPVPPNVEYTVIGATYGPDNDEVRHKAQQDLPLIMNPIRSQLLNVEERRRYERFAAKFPVAAYPRYSDGVIGTPIAGSCCDISVDGIRFVTPVPVRTASMYLEIKEIAGIERSAILVHTLRTHLDAGGLGYVTAGRFRPNA